MFSLPQVAASAINPILTILLLSAPFYKPKPAGPWRFWGRSALGLGLAVIVTESGKYWEVWPGHPSFPSGHETFGLAVATSLVVWDRRWLGLALPLTLLLAWALVAAHYHTPVDVAGAWLVGPPCVLLCHRLGRKPHS